MYVKQIAGITLTTFALYDFLERVTPVLEIKAETDTNGNPQMVVRLKASNILGRPLYPYKYHRGLGSYWLPGHKLSNHPGWEIRNCTFKQPSTKQFELALANVSKETIQSEGPNYIQQRFLHDFLENRVETEVRYTDHWGNPRIVILKWEDAVVLDEDEDEHREWMVLYGT